jgi:hypothetical protein
MHIEKFLIAGGNPTLLIWGCPEDKQVSLSKQYLESGDAEQVGFISHENGVMYLTMMGNELCINASLALASVSGAGGSFFTRGIDYLVSYTKNEWTTIDLRLPFKHDGNTVLFDGIGFSCYNHKVTVSKEKVIELAKHFNLPAFGIITCINNKITPYVYVVDTGLLIGESACGSGSIAASVIFGFDDIIQPSGETIRIKRKGNVFTVSAQVRVVPDQSPNPDIKTTNKQYAKSDSTNGTHER